MLYEALEKYTAAVRDLKEHQQNNQAVFTAHQALLFKVVDAENELRDEAAADSMAETGGQIKNQTFVVALQPQSQTWADIDTLDRLIAEGKIAPELRPMIVMTQARPVRITIKEQKQ